MSGEGSAIGHLFEPISVGSVVLPNRVFVPGHTTNLATNNLPTERHIAYHSERARGGVGLIITEAIRVHPTSAGRDRTLGCFDDGCVAPFRRLVDAVHRYDTRFFAQLQHSGRQASGSSLRTDSWSAGAIPWTQGGQVPHIMGRQEIDEVARAFATAATRMVSAGFDGIEVHVGHGHLLQQFLSPAVNQRTDQYGGSFENRLRFPVKVLRNIYEAVHGSLPIGIRISADEFLEGGLTVDDMLHVVSRLNSQFALAYVNVSHSAYVGAYSLSTQIADMSFSEAPFREFPRHFKDTFPNLPIFGACRFDNLDVAARLVADGYVDVAGLARAHIADPHLVSKARTGRQHEVRSCLACNQGCIGRIEQSLPVSCVVNPDAGDEARWIVAWHKARRTESRRRVLVVGSGAAGLEAAVTASSLGHAVTVAERTSSCGGLIGDVATLRGRERLGLLVGELERDAVAAGVEFRLHTVVDAELVLAGDYDDVLIATGSYAYATPVCGAQNVFTPDDVLAMHRDPRQSLGDHVIVFDEEGGWPTASIVDHLIQAGIHVELVSPMAGLLNQITTYSRLAVLERLRRFSVGVHLLHRPIESVDDGFDLVDVVSGRTTTLADVDAVISVAPRHANDELYRELEGHGESSLHLVGDARSPRSALEAVYEARRAVLSLGSAPRDARRVVTAQLPAV